jgi:hypothetical protein
MPQPHSTLEKDVQQILSQGTQILGAPAPRKTRPSPLLPAKDTSEGVSEQKSEDQSPDIRQDLAD